MSCQHRNVVCLNGYELIRKYRCLKCGEVMMCACDEAFGRRFLPHQLSHGTELATQVRVPVTIGFQPAVCPECRGLPPEPYPKAAGYRQTSKLKRYYWRELHRRETEILAEWADSEGIQENPLFMAGPEVVRAREAAAKQALNDVKRLHAANPKYTYEAEVSQADIIAQCNVDVLPLKGVYVQDETVRGARIVSGDEQVSAEEFAARHFRQHAYETLFVESIPFHVLFGTCMWLVIQDPTDERVRIVSFGDRTACTDGMPSREIFCHLPDDFGSLGYGQRRKTAIDRHFREMLEPDDSEWLFDYWLSHSENLRQYLWAHREEDIATARELWKILPKTKLLTILRYLVDSYWKRYLGWPDLLVFRGDEYFFAEAKSSNDKLSDDQKRWIQDNHQILKLPFKLVKIHKIGSVDS